MPRKCRRQSTPPPPSSSSSLLLPWIKRIDEPLLLLNTTTTTNIHINPSSVERSALNDVGGAGCDINANAVAPMTPSPAPLPQPLPLPPPSLLPPAPVSYAIRARFSECGANFGQRTWNGCSFRLSYHGTIEVDERAEYDSGRLAAARAKRVASGACDAHLRSKKIMVEDAVAKLKVGLL